MARCDDAPSVCIIGGKKYILEKRNLLCKVCVSNPRTFFDLYSKTKCLHYPQGKAFVMRTYSDMTGAVISTEILTEAEAHKFMDKYPDGINESVYVRYFGEPEEV